MIVNKYVNYRPVVYKLFSLHKYAIEDRRNCPNIIGLEIYEYVFYTEFTQNANANK